MLRLRRVKSVASFGGALRSAAEKTRQKDGALDRHVERLSRFLWPVQETWLPVVVGSLCILDYASTYVALRFGRNTNIIEDGPLAGWALRTGGFAFLFLVDMAAAGALSLMAFAARYLYRRSGFRGYGRAAFVAVLAPYVIRTAIVVVNNLVVGFG